jgi:tRNA-splicing ligase RtcB
MVAVETSIGAAGLPDNLDRLLAGVEEAIPSGVGKGHTFATRSERDRHAQGVPAYTGGSELTASQMSRVTAQFGTLGSGNHFVEVCLDERDVVWLVLHSGSRGIGNRLATAHIDKAKGLMRQYFIELEDADLAYLVEGSPEFDAYIADMLWAQDYAKANRDAMMDALLTQLWACVGTGHEVRRVNCHHNYTERERHFGRSVWLTRKGAIRAREGDLGVIPGSMGTSSYIVRGLGNPSSYCSAAHGAGRRLSRSRARREFSVESLESAMKDVTWNAGEARQLLDEHPNAYKDVDQVMADQADLVAVEHTLHQVLNYKGT